MIHSAITISLVPEARGGPFVFWEDLAAGCAKAAALGFDAVEIFPRAADELNAKELKGLLQRNKLKLAAMGTGAGPGCCSTDSGRTTRCRRFWTRPSTRG